MRPDSRFATERSEFVARLLDGVYLGAGFIGALWIAAQMWAYIAASAPR